MRVSSGMLAGVRMARAIAAASPDPYLKVGAMVIDDGRLTGAGHNRPPVGVKVDYSDREARRVLMVHAEVVALLAAPRHPGPHAGRILVSNVMPCQACLTFAANSDVSEVYWADLPDPDRYPLADSEAHARRLGITLVRVFE